MKVGDLVHMPDEHVPKGYTPSVGLIVADDYDKVAPGRPAGRKKSRIGVMWADSNCVDYEPRAWLEVIK
jgi:hypothetical protein